MDFGTTLPETLNQEETSLTPGHFSHFWAIPKSFPSEVLRDPKNNKGKTTLEQMEIK